MSDKQSHCVRTERICLRIAELHRERCKSRDDFFDVRAQVQASRLWNWIDHQDEPEPLWAIMHDEVPFVFADRDNTNSMMFAYACEVIGGAS